LRLAKNGGKRKIEKISKIVKKVRGEVVPVLIKHYLMKTYEGVDVEIHIFLTSALVWRCMVSFTPRSLYSQGKSPRYPLDRRLGAHQGQSGP
jgi:hypothetical protein